MKLLFTTGILLLSTTGYPQVLKSTVTSSFNLLNSYSRLNNDPFSFTFNTAALAQQKNFAAGVYAENRFQLKETTLYRGVANMPTQLGNFGIQVDHFGFKNYNENQLGAAYARSLGESFDLGIQFNYFSYRVPSYSEASSVNFQIGAIARLTEQLNTGFQIYNPVGGYLSKEHEEKLASVYQFGISYEPSENVIIHATVEKEEDRDLNVIAGLYYHFEKRFIGRVGVETLNSSPFGAIGIAFNDFRIDFAASYHNQLGFSPGFMFIYNPVKRKE